MVFDDQDAGGGRRHRHKFIKLDEAGAAIPNDSWGVQAPRRILVAVEPRLLGDALAALLEDIGLDEVTRRGTEDPSQRFDVALRSEGVTGLRAALVLQVPDAVELAEEGSGDLRPATARELLEILDRVCPTSAPRIDGLARVLAGGGQ